MEETQSLMRARRFFTQRREHASCSRIQARYVLALMSFLGFFNAYCLRGNLSVALVAMVTNPSSDNVNASDECPGAEITANVTRLGGEFDWDQNSQSLILGAFYYGYILTQVPGGWLAEKMGGKLLFGAGILCTSILTLFTPLAARAGVPYLVAVRVLEGVGEGVTYPTMHAMWGDWSPVYERSMLATFSSSGAQLGTVFVMPISGLLCEHGFAGGWPSVFYVFGAFGCVWFLFWLLLVYDTPARHPRITMEERKYIESSIGGKRKKIPTPWKRIVTSPEVWGIMTAHFANNWGLYGMLTCLPIYLKTVLHFNIQENGLLSSLPHLVMLVTQIFISYVADCIRSRRYLSTVVSRKLMNTLGQVLPACLMLAAGFSGCDAAIAVALLTLSLGFSGFAMAGFNVNHLDIAPRFAGTLLGITNMVGTIPGFVGPTVLGVLTNENQTFVQWRVFFYLTAALYLAGAALFCILAKGEELSWARSPQSVASIATQSLEVTSLSQQASVLV
ncbi:sialin-like [Pomacea canaliculata]|nr:sialin-like [Pomacea canaliculata]XP_025090961.1 sialin-like [Pomacea canaliculata]